MKPATRAVAYALIYPGMSKVANQFGYALTMQGSMERDFDLVAIPWTEDATEPEPMIRALMDLLGAVFFPDLLARQGLSPEEIERILEQTQGDGKVRAHGRRAWSLHLGNGSYIDLSVMPLKETTKDFDNF